MSAEAFLAGTGPVTRYWERKHSALSGLYRFAVARGYVDHSPLPRTVPRPQQAFVPYIYSHEELRRLLNAIPANDHPRCRIDPDTYRTILLLLYGAGLRISEALALTLADVDLDAAVLSIRESKFYKSRLVPIGNDLLRIMAPYAARRRQQYDGPASPFFVSRDGTAVTRQNAEMALCRLRVRANVLCEAGDARHQPRLHDMRHAFAVHRLVAWYRDGADVQRLLPKLSTYLGHVHIAGTQRYLTLTPELLRQASLRFERYAMEPPVNNEALLGPWVRRFLLEHIVAERNLARNTQHGYRDALCQLIPFVARQSSKPIDRLTIIDISAECVRRFLADLEASRHCGIATRNQRLAAIRALARFVGEHSPIHIEWSGQIRAIPFKKTMQAVVPYLEKAEIDALLAAPDRRTTQGQRDHALLLFLYNTGARASEAAQVTIADLDLNAASVKISGKGGKQRFCPLWSATVSELATTIAGGEPSRPLFLNRCGRPITRFGIHTVLERTAMKAQAHSPALATKRVSPHSIRHTTATHLLRAGVDINTIRGWLGHVSLETTNVYAEIDFETKAKALAKCEIASTSAVRQHWRDQPALRDFLRAL